MQISVAIDNQFEIDKIDPVYRKLFQESVPFLDTRNNVIHTYIVYQFVIALLEHESGDSEIALPAGIMHDVGWSAISESEQLRGFGPNVRDEGLRRKHEIEGVAITKKILNTFGYDAIRIKKILGIIDGHDTTGNARCPEDAIVKDADKLWRYSETGFHIDVERFEVDPVSYIEYLTGKISQWFLTEKGRSIAVFEAYQRKKEIGL